MAYQSDETETNVAILAEFVPLMLKILRRKNWVNVADRTAMNVALSQHRTHTELHQQLAWILAPTPKETDDKRDTPKTR